MAESPERDQAWAGLRDTLGRAAPGANRVLIPSETIERYTREMEEHPEKADELAAQFRLELKNLIKDHAETEATAKKLLDS